MSKPQTIDFDTAVGMLRQWLNEDRIKDAKRFVTNEDLHSWLDVAVSERERLARIDEVGRMPNPAYISGVKRVEPMRDYKRERFAQLKEQEASGEAGEGK